MTFGSHRSLRQNSYLSLLSLDLKGFLMKECVTDLVYQDNLYDFRQVAVNDDAGLSTFPHTEAFATVWISSKRKLLNNNMK